MFDAVEAFLSTCRYKGKGTVHRQSLLEEDSCIHSVQNASTMSTEANTPTAKAKADSLSSLAHGLRPSSASRLLLASASESSAESESGPGHDDVSTESDDGGRHTQVSCHAAPHQVSQPFARFKLEIAAQHVQQDDISHAPLSLSPQSHHQPDQSLDSLCSPHISAAARLKDAASGSAHALSVCATHQVTEASDGLTAHNIRQRYPHLFEPHSTAAALPPDDAQCHSDRPDFKAESTCSRPERRLKADPVDVALSRVMPELSMLKVTAAPAFVAANTSTAESSATMLRPAIAAATAADTATAESSALWVTQFPAGLIDVHNNGTASFRNVVSGPQAGGLPKVWHASSAVQKKLPGAGYQASPLRQLLQASYAGLANSQQTGFSGTASS